MIKLAHILEATIGFLVGALVSMIDVNNDKSIF